MSVQGHNFMPGAPELVKLPSLDEIDLAIASVREFVIAQPQGGAEMDPQTRDAVARYIALQKMRVAVGEYEQSRTEVTE